MQNSQGPLFVFSLIILYTLDRLPTCPRHMKYFFPLTYVFNHDQTFCKLWPSEKQSLAETNASYKTKYGVRCYCRATRPTSSNDTLDAQFFCDDHSCLLPYDQRS
jgi:hypothetical protein